ncbi:hypothetical protein ABPG74_018734 [Tetrahymena malaccensis]
MNTEEHHAKKGILSKKRTLEKKDLTWDEKTIEEHDKERGKTMKITEPKTPYNNDFNENEHHDSEIDGLKQAEINKQHQQEKGKLDLSKLNEMLKEDLDRERKEMAVDSDEEDEIKKKKKEEFQKKRKAHYNEGVFIKKAIIKDEEEDV